MTASIATLDFEPELVLASFHGLPKEYLEKGDPYHCQCLKTTRLLRERLGWPKEKLRTVFQSRFGRAEWLQPYTDVTIARTGQVRRQADRGRSCPASRPTAWRPGRNRHTRRRDVPREWRRALCRDPLPE